MKSPDGDLPPLFLQNVVRSLFDVRFQTISSSATSMRCAAIMPLLLQAVVPTEPEHLPASRRGRSRCHCRISGICARTFATSALTPSDGDKRFGARLLRFARDDKVIRVPSSAAKNFGNRVQILLLRRHDTRPAQNINRIDFPFNRSAF